MMAMFGMANMRSALFQVLFLQFSHADAGKILMHLKFHIAA